jgi:hypothetical protein
MDACSSPVLFQRACVTDYLVSLCAFVFLSVSRRFRHTPASARPVQRRTISRESARVAHSSHHHAFSSSFSMKHLATARHVVDFLSLFWRRNTRCRSAEDQQTHEQLRRLPASICQDSHEPARMSVVCALLECLVPHTVHPSSRSTDLAIAVAPHNVRPATRNEARVSIQ